MKNIYFVLILSSLLFSSCEKWFEGQVVELDIPTHTPELTAYSYLKSGQKFVDIRVGKSVGILSSDDPEIVDNATIKLFKNDALFKEFSSSGTLVVDTIGIWPQPDTTYVYVDSFYRFGVELEEVIPSTPDKYEFEISAPNFETITASQTMPELSQVKDATLAVGATVDDFGDRADLLVVTLEDDGSKENYYVMEVLYEDSFDSTYFNDMYVFSFDPAAEQGHEGPVFRDLTFNGQDYQARLSVYNWSGEKPGKVRIRLGSVTKDYYTFSKSMSQYWNAYGNPFAEPVVLYSNFENGLGLFSAMSVTEYEFTPK